MTPAGAPDAQVVVLGAGLAGLAAAAHLRARGITVAVYEREEVPGGHARSARTDGYVFDRGPHVSFTKRADIRAELAGAVAGEFVDEEAELLNYWRGRWIPQPAQSNLHGLPAQLVEDCIVSLAEARAGRAREPASYAEWCEQQLGRAFSEEFTFRYTRKYWTAEAADLTTDWIGPRVHPPSVREMVRGALSPDVHRTHYITRFRYPAAGGFGRYVDGLFGAVPVHTARKAVEVDATRREVAFADGGRARYEALVSTLPLPELVAIMKDVPARVRAAARELACTSLVLVNVGLRRREGLPAAHWFYVYDEDIVFARVNLPHLICPANAPPGCGSLQVEVYHSTYRPLPVADVTSAVIDGLTRMGLLQEHEIPALVQEEKVPYANVLFDRKRAPSLAAVRAHLADVGIHTAGRYGRWEYLWTDDSILSGRAAAGEVAQRLAPAKS